MNSQPLFSPAAERNTEPLARAIADALPASGLVLEIASGTGQHISAFARLFPELIWQPSDPDREARASIAAYRERAALANLRAPLDLDAASTAWPISEAEAILNVNMIHISPWESTLGLFAGAARTLPKSAPLILYGPYFVEGKPTASSNLDFDFSLRSRNPAWGVRKLEDVVEVGEGYGFFVESVTEMPANNLTVIFRR